MDFTRQLSKRPQGLHPVTFRTPQQSTNDIHQNTCRTETTKTAGVHKTGEMRAIKTEGEGAIQLVANSHLIRFVPISWAESTKTSREAAHGKCIMSTAGSVRHISHQVGGGQEGTALA